MTKKCYHHEGGRDERDEILNVGGESPDDWTFTTGRGEYFCTPLVGAALRRGRGDLAEKVSRIQSPNQRNRAWTRFE